MVKPIRPSEVGEAQMDGLPDFVKEAFNGMIASRNVNGRSTFTVNEVISAIIGCCTTQTLDRKQIFDNHWLDVEQAYRANGWVVEYVQPDYTESFDAYFVFKAKRRVR